MRSASAFVAFALILGSASYAADRVRPVTRVAPEYPVAALEQDLPGRVSAWLVVDDDGDVTDVEIIAESPADFGFGEAAGKAFAKWKYPSKAAGRYKATFTFAISPLGLTAEEAKLSLAAPPISTARADYPSRAIDSNVTGEAKVVATIDERGRVESVRIADESPPGFGFGFSARDAVLFYRFKPGPRAVWVVTIKYRFYGDSGRTEIAVRSEDLPMAPEPRRAGRMDYPYKARIERVEGWAELGIQIDKRGRITHGGVLSEYPQGYGFGASAYRSLEAWRYDDVKPGSYKLRVEFKLDD